MPLLSMVVLAGGRSSRMGTDKADLKFHGTTFLELQLKKGQRLGISDILVSGYRGSLPGVPIVEDRLPGRGPLGGMEACLRRAKGDRVLVLGVDVPLVPVSELKALIDKSGEDGPAAVILKHGEKEEPLIGVYRRNLADALLRELSEGKGSVFAFLKHIGYGVYESGAPDRCFANINSPEDFRQCLESSGDSGTNRYVL